MPIVDDNWDDATYYGDEDDGVYVSVGQGPDGKWYFTASVDCNSGHFVDVLRRDEGPYETEEEAKEAGKAVAIEWCQDNDVRWDDQDA